MECFVVDSYTWPWRSINEEVFTSDTCDVAVDFNSLEFDVVKAFKILVVSRESWSSDPHSNQRLWSFGRTLKIDDRSWETLFDESKETMDEMPAVVWTTGERLFVGDIQDQIIEGNTSRENPLYPHRDISNAFWPY